MSYGRDTLFVDEHVMKPGEYTSNCGVSGGFIAIAVPELDNATIFVCSKNYVKPLQQFYKIPDSNVMSMINRCNSSPTGIPEENLPGKIGLNMFIERLHRSNPDARFPVIIHCSAGRNRSPVAAVIYLITKGVDSARAIKLVTEAYISQRDKNFVLNPFKNYSEVLALACSLKENIDPNTLTVSKPVTRSMRNAGNCKPRTLNFG